MERFKEYIEARRKVEKKMKIKYLIFYYLMGEINRYNIRTKLMAQEMGSHNY